MNTEIKKDCFAYCEKGKKNKKESCHALIELECKECSFYKQKDKIKNNPFYASSYSSKIRHKEDLKKRNIKEEQVKWD